MAGGSDGEFGLDKEKRAAFAHQAVHQTSQTAKLIQAYYGQEVAYSYFNGCSDGGREAVMEAIRYPNDFDGIIAGAPAMLFTFQNSFHHGWLAVSNTDNDGNRVVMLRFFTMLLSKHASNNSTYLTSAEVEAVTKFYNGPVDARSGKHLTVGEEHTNTALAAIKYLIFEEYPGDNYTLNDFDFSDSTIDLLRSRHPLLDAVSSDLSEFHKAGGKLILWHGWADPHISPRTTIA
ncbi:hypothetical protein PF008_g32360, partial [Phytophthora fragariae]